MGIVTDAHEVAVAAFRSFGRNPVRLEVRCEQCGRRMATVRDTPRGPLFESTEIATRQAHPQTRKEFGRRIPSTPVVHLCVVGFVAPDGSTADEDLLVHCPKHGKRQLKSEEVLDAFPGSARMRVWTVEVA